jgi:hypothetical protein
MKDKNATDVQKAQVFDGDILLISVGHKATSFEVDGQLYVWLSWLYKISLLRETVGHVDHIQRS